MQNKTTSIKILKNISRNYIKKIVSKEWMVVKGFYEVKVMIEDENVLE
jgi:hypothetical protein